MEKLSFFNRIAMAFVLVAGLMLTACNPDGPTQIAEEDQELAELDAMVEATFEEVDNISYEGMDEAFGRDYQTPGVGTLSPCVVVTHDTVSKILTLDFGTGCVGNDGKTRAGKIVIDYTQRLWRPGATMTVTLDSFYVDSLHIEGTKTHTNLATSFNDPITLNTTLVGGQITWPDGTSATRTFDRTRTWNRAPNPAMDELIITGTASGTRRNGVNFTTTILTPKVYRRACRAQGIHIAAEGVVEIQRTGKPTVTVDYGNGSCDTDITLTVNGQSTTITL